MNATLPPQETGPRIVLSLACAGLQRLIECVRASRAADLVEVRLDALEAAERLRGEDLAALTAAAPRPLLATCRPVWQGGGFRGDENARRALLRAALAAGAALVDVELEAPWAAELLAAARSSVLLSHHASEGPAADWTAIARRMAEARPRAAKLVAAGTRPTDALALLPADRLLARAGVARACFCMGQETRASRLLNAAAGGALIYAAPEVDRPTAAGQWPLERLREEFLLPRWRSSMARYGVVGDPIEHSLSPAVFNAAFAARHEAALYMPLPGAPLAEVLAVAEAHDVAGLSVTMPYKQAAAAACRTLSQEARLIGAVNTLSWRDGAWHGDNTDGVAVREVLARRLPLRGARVAILGAGGAARAAAVALLGAGAEVCLLNRTHERAVAAAEELGCAAAPPPELRRRRWQVLVNATPVGLLSTDDTPVPTAWLRGDEIVLEMNYRPRRTRLLREAAARGCTPVEGLEMFLAQAALQYRIWRGAEGPRRTMAAAAARFLPRQAGAGAEEARG